MKLRVRGELAVVRPEQLPAQTDSGLWLVHEGQSYSMKGTVVALGEGPRSRGGALLPHVVSIGDKVIFPKEAGEELVFKKETLIVMRETDILAIIEE